VKSNVVKFLDSKIAKLGCSRKRVLQYVIFLNSGGLWAMQMLVYLSIFGIIMLK